MIENSKERGRVWGLNLIKDFISKRKFRHSIKIDAYWYNKRKDYLPRKIPKFCLPKRRER